MSIHWRNGCRDLLLRALTALEMPLPGIKMAEFGNQRVKFEPESGARRLQAAKPFFEFFGVRHVSFDTNGRSGALAWDLAQPIDPVQLRQRCGIGLGEFDLVTNFGTSEHVETNQQQVFWNADALCRTGGLMVHAVPRLDSCRKHGVWKYSAEWFRELAERQHYRIVHLAEWDKTEHWGAHRIAPGTELYVMAILRKTWNPQPEFFPAVWHRDPWRQR